MLSSRKTSSNAQWYKSKTSDCTLSFKEALPLLHLLIRAIEDIFEHALPGFLSDTDFETRPGTIRRLSSS